MKITWSLPVRGQVLSGSRGDLVRARGLIEALRAAGHEVEVVECGAVSARSGPVAFYRRVVRRMLPGRAGLVVRDLGRVIHSVSHARRVASRALGSGAQLLVETQVHFADSGARAARRTGLPLLLDDCSPASEEEALGCGLPFLARAVFRRQVSAARALIVPGDHLRRRLVAEGVPASKLRVIPNAAAGRRARRDRDRSGIRIFLPRGATVFVFAGSFQPWHGTDLLVQALAHPRAPAGAVLLLLGEGPGRDGTLRLAASLGVGRRVLAPGAIPADSLPDQLASCHVGVLGGSNDYGQPMKLLEYAAAGLPVLAPDIPTVRALVEDGVTGLLFPPGDAAALAGGMEHLTRDVKLRRSLGQEARMLAAHAGGWRERALALLEALEPEQPTAPLEPAESAA